MLFLWSFAFLASKAADYYSLLHELTTSIHFSLLLNFVVFSFLMWGILSTWLLFGNLRAIEVDHMLEQLPFFGLNLLFILFNDNNVLLGLLWGAITVLTRVYHMINLDRLELLQLNTVNSLDSINTSTLILRHFVSSKFVWYIALFMCFDVFMAKLLVYDVFQGVSSIPSLLYGLQFAVMAIDNIAYIGKLSLNVYELMYYRCPSPRPVSTAQPASRSSDPSAMHTGQDRASDDVGSEIEVPELSEIPDEPETTTLEPIDDSESEDEDDETERVWESKSMYIQSLDIGSSVIKSLVYWVFSYVLYFHSDITPPLPMLQGGIMNIFRVANKAKTFISYLSNAKYWDRHLLNATAEDLDGADHMCIICRDNMHLPHVYQARRHKPLSSRKHPKKLSCGHILHMGCLKDWLERSSNCPLCRQSVFPSAPEPETNAVPQTVFVPNTAFVPNPEFVTNTEATQEVTINHQPQLMFNQTETNISQEMIDRTDRISRRNNALMGRRMAQNRANEPVAEANEIPEANFDEIDSKGWVLLPLSRNSLDQISIRLSATTTGFLTVRDNTRHAPFYTLGSA